MQEVTVELERLIPHETLYYELHHVILPELEDQGLIEFDRGEDTVRRGPRFDAVGPVLERFDAR